MARTKQTARKSTGGVPNRLRRQMAVCNGTVTSGVTRTPQRHLPSIKEDGPTTRTRETGRKCTAPMFSTRRDTAPGRQTCHKSTGGVCKNPKTRQLVTKSTGDMAHRIQPDDSSSEEESSENTKEESSTNNSKTDRELYDDFNRRLDALRANLDIHKKAMRDLISRTLFPRPT